MSRPKKKELTPVQTMRLLERAEQCEYTDAWAYYEAGLARISRSTLASDSSVMTLVYMARRLVMQLRHFERRSNPQGDA